MSTWTALVCAVAAMFSNSLASLLEASGSRRATLGHHVWKQPRYVVGLAFDCLGWVLSVAALRVLPVFAVQSVLAGSVAVTSLVAGRRGRTRTERLGVGAVVLGLVAVAASAATGRAGALPSGAAAALVVAAAVVLAGLWWVLRAGRPLLTALAAGLAFGGVSLSVRAVHVDSVVRTSQLDLLREPLSYAVVVFGLCGIVLVAAALRRGAVGTVTAVLSVTQVVVPGLIGIAMLGDRVREGWLPVAGAGLVVTVAGVLVLARHVPHAAVPGGEVLPDRSPGPHQEDPDGREPGAQERYATEG